jgi:serine/threonine-protein kinase
VNVPEPKNPAGGGRPERCTRCGSVAHGTDACPTPGATPGWTLGFGSAGPPGPTVDPLLGARVGSFQIVRMLGRGGMGTVYLAEHPVIGSRVAIKFLHESMSGDAEVVARFYDEARAVNLIGHENIVGVYDLSMLPPDRYYYVMEYLEGETLAARAHEGRLPTVVALEVLLQLCEALAAAHEQGVVHRDLKPENVFLVVRRGRDHVVKLVDFGVAKLRGDLGPKRTQAGVLVGTPEYMAPEQCDDGPIDARTDVYALGVMAFELFTGQLPFTARSTSQLLLAQLGKPPPRPSQLAPVDPELERAILTALEKDPARRFPDMSAFADALRPIHARLLGGGPSPPPATPARAPAARPIVTPTQALPPDPPALEIRATVQLGGEPAVSLPVVELTRAGLFLRAEAALPPVFSRVRVTLTHPALRAPLALAAEVVRHVTPAEAAAVRMAPGFALQVAEISPEARAALAELADLLRPPPPDAAPRPAAQLDARLDALEARAGADPYALLGVPPDAEFSALRRAAGALREELELVRTRPQAPAHAGRATALQVRVEAAMAAVGAPAPRLAHDARTGNWRGVRRALKAGVPEALVAARREALLAAEPARRAEAERQLARARVAHKLGNAAAAAAAFEAALAADPLDAAAHEAFDTFRRG